MFYLINVDRPWSEAAFCDVWSRYLLFAMIPFMERCPAGIWLLYNVASTSMQRDVASMLMWRCIDANVTLW